MGPLDEGASMRELAIDLIPGMVGPGGEAELVIGVAGSPAASQRLTFRITEAPPPSRPQANAFATPDPDEANADDLLADLDEPGEHGHSTRLPDALTPQQQTVLAVLNRDDDRGVDAGIELTLASPALPCLARQTRRGSRSTPGAEP